MITAIEEMCQVFKHSREEQERIEKSYFRAEILSGGDRFKGRAIFEFEQEGSGMFFPDCEMPKELPFNQAVILKSSNEQETLLKDFKLCFAPAPLHYHFSFEATR